MDCNSYSYAPHMLENKPVIATYENDDMYSSIDAAARGNIGEWINGYEVYSGSYDGSLEVCEFFRTIDAARFLHDSIVERYHFTPPESKRELRKLINAAHRMDKGRWLDHVPA